MYILFSPTPELYNCSRFYHLKFAEKEENDDNEAEIIKESKKRPFTYLQV